MAMSDRIVVMRTGRIEQVGGPLEIYDTPRTRFVADFIGAANLVRGPASLDPATGEVLIGLDGAELRCARPAAPPSPGPDGQQLVAIRTVYPELRRPPQPAAPNQWAATVRRRTFLGDIVHYVVAWPGGELRVHGFPGALFEEGETVILHIPAERVVLIEHSE